jgi:hypothetical protein
MIKQAYGEGALGRSALFKWHKHFAHGTDSLEDEERTGRTRTVGTEFTISKVATPVLTNGR